MIEEFSYATCSIQGEGNRCIRSLFRLVGSAFKVFRSCRQNIRRRKTGTPDLSCMMLYVAVTCLPTVGRGRLCFGNAALVHKQTS